MNPGRMLLILLGLAAGLAGCDRSPTAVVERPEPSPPAGRAGEAADVSKDSAPHVATVFMTVDEQPLEFPPPRLVMRERNGRTVVVLMSDDPPEAINPDYRGNSYYLEMEFDERLTSLRGEQWHYQAPSADRIDSPHGIFLEGNRRQLQPFQMSVKFPSADDETLWISGTFYLFSNLIPPGSERPPPPRLVPVTARMVLQVP